MANRARKNSKIVRRTRAFNLSLPENSVLKSHTKFSFNYISTFGFSDRVAIEHYSPDKLNISRFASSN